MYAQGSTFCLPSSKLAAPGNLKSYASKHCRSRKNLRCRALDSNPYEALERAVQVINRIIEVGETAKSRGHAWRSGEHNGQQHRPERWVQFGASSSSRLPLLQAISSYSLKKENSVLHSLTSSKVSGLLEEYLALPIDEYALLDPKWVQRESPPTHPQKESASSDPDTEGETPNPQFRLSVPLREVIGVDLRPELSISAHPDPEGACVTMLGSKAALGSPKLDEAFKLELIAVLSSKHQRRRLPPLPGRPVHRLRQWAARRQNREADGSSSSSTPAVEVAAVADVVSSHRQGDDDDDDDDDFIPSGGALIPGEKVYVSKDADDDEESYAAEALSSSPASASIRGSKNAINSASLDGRTTAATSAGANAEDPALHFRVDITMAVRVPGALRVVPNPLLGYAGSMILRAVLNGALPNFLQLLSADFGRWVDGGRRRDGDAATGDLFSVPPPETAAVVQQVVEEEECLHLKLCNQNRVESHLPMKK